MLRMLLGYLAALATPAFVVASTVHKGTFVTQFFGMMTAELIFSLLPFVACVSIGHAYRIRNPFYYAAWAIVPIVILGLLFGFGGRMLDALLVPSMVSGLVYWAIAGRLAGRAAA